MLISDVKSLSSTGLLFFTSFLQNCAVTEQATAPRVGIIGAGVGGSSVAYYLNQLLPSAEIEIFERSEFVGGRVNVTTVFGNGYETGGSIIHGRNKHAVDLAKKFGFEKKVDTGEAMSILKGDEYVLNTSKWTIITALKVLYRYGWDFNKMTNLVGGFIDQFSRIYELQEKGEFFTTPEEMLESMSPSLLNLTRSNTYSLLKSEGLSDLFISELAAAILYVNYGQSLSIPALVGSVGCAGGDGDLWAVKNGNRQLPASMITESGATLHLGKPVTTVVLNPDSSFTLKSSETVLGTYSHVVLAYPVEGSRTSITFTGFPTQPYTAGNRRYHRTVATIVAGHVHSKYASITNILTCDTSNFFTSISLLHPTILVVAEKYPVYKIFSPKPLTDSQLSSIFTEIQHVEVHDWLAYPEYTSTPPEFPPFVLHPRMYYVNAVEWAASAIEMSLISGKNIALMIHSEFQ